MSSIIERLQVVDTHLVARLDGATVRLTLPESFDDDGGYQVTYAVVDRQRWLTNYQLKKQIARVMRAVIAAAVDRAHSVIARQGEVECSDNHNPA